MTDFVISDLHLAGNTPKLNEAFFTFLKQVTDRKNRLFILGDFFNFWVGDDFENDHSRSVSQALRQAHNAGLQCFLIVGNRDFLIGSDFCFQSALTLLDPKTTMEIGGIKTLLLHGDELCTNDLRYMQLRHQLRSTVWQQHFLSQSIEKRLEEANNLRKHSKQDTMIKALDEMDVADDAVVSNFQIFDVQYMIHGHTHLPNIHDLVIKGVQHQRWVLGDWGEKLWYIKAENKQWKLLNEVIS